MICRQIPRARSGGQGNKINESIYKDNAGNAGLAGHSPFSTSGAVRYSQTEVTVAVD